MKKTELTKQLKTLGWHVEKDETGDNIAHFALPDRKLRIIPANIYHPYILQDDCFDIITLFTISSSLANQSVIVL